MLCRKQKKILWEILDIKVDFYFFQLVHNFFNNSEEKKKTLQSFNSVNVLQITEKSAGMSGHSFG